MKKLAYTDLTDSNYVFEALLGYGMFSEKLPPCFTSENIFNYLKSKDLDKTKPYAAPQVFFFIRTYIFVFRAMDTLGLLLFIGCALMKL